MTTSVMTLAEIEALCPSEWVLIENPQTNEALEVQSGTVVVHSPDRDTVYREAVARRPKRFAILYTGQMPAGTAIVV